MFDDIPGEEASLLWATSPGEARVNRAVRNQMEMVVRALDSVIPDNHPARAIWGFLERLELSSFYSSIKSVVTSPGRPATDPQVLLALWVYATVEGIGSARRLERLCREQDGYRWLAGGVPINYHMLSDFRVEHKEDLGRLLSEIIASMMAAGLVRLKGVAQDGLRVRASAGSSSFRRRERLSECLRQAKEQVERLAEEGDEGESSRREEAARERAARERQERVERALKNLEQVQAAKERRKKRPKRGKKISESRASTTDPEARVMKMPDGGFRPAYNVQLATDVESRVIVGVGVSNRGSDQGEALGMEEQVSERAGKPPERYLLDAGFINLKQIEEMKRSGVEVYAPPKPSRGGRPPKAKDRPEVARWRARMATEEGKRVYKDRCSSAEWVNAQMRERHGVRQFNVRGLAKVTAVVLLVAIAHNLLRWMAFIA